MSEREGANAPGGITEDDTIENIVALPVNRIVVNGKGCFRKTGYKYESHTEGGLMTLVRIEKESLTEYIKRFALIVNDWINIIPEENFWSKQEIALNLATWQLMVAYQGFDPLITVITFNYYATNPILGDLEQDLAFLIMLFFERGSDIKKMVSVAKSKMSQKGRKTCLLLEARYQIEPKGAKAASDVLTLPRIAMSFPIQSCMYAEHRISWPVQPVNLTDKRNVVACQTLGALIPTDSKIDMTPLIKAHGWFQYRLSMLINTKKFEEKTMDKRKEETMSFIALSMKSKLPYSTETKERFLRSRNIMDSNNIFHTEIITYARKWDVSDFIFDPPLPVSFKEDPLSQKTLQEKTSLEPLACHRHSELLSIDGRRLILQLYVCI